MPVSTPPSRISAASGPAGSGFCPLWKNDPPLPRKAALNRKQALPAPPQETPRPTHTCRLCPPSSSGDGHRHGLPPELRQEYTSWPCAPNGSASGHLQQGYAGK